MSNPKFSFRKLSRKEQADFWKRVRAHPEMREMPRDVRLTETNFAFLRNFLEIQKAKTAQALHEERMKSHLSRRRPRKR